MEEQYLKTLKPSFDKDSDVFIPGFLLSNEVVALNKQIKRFIPDKIHTMSTKHFFITTRRICPS